MKKYILSILIVFCSLTSYSYAANHHYVCSDWAFLGTGSCASDVITIGGGDSDAIDGSYGGSTNSSFNLINGTTYYVVWNSVTGSGTHWSVDVCCQTSYVVFTGGSSSHQASFVPSANNKQLMFENDNLGNGSGVAGTISDICVSDVSYSDCTGGGGGGGGGGSPNSSTTVMVIDNPSETLYNGILIFIGTLFLLAFYFKRK